MIKPDISDKGEIACSTVFPLAVAIAVATLAGYSIRLSFAAQVVALDLLYAAATIFQY